MADSVSKPVLGQDNTTSFLAPVHKGRRVSLEPVHDIRRVILPNLTELCQTTDIIHSGLYEKLIEKEVLTAEEMDILKVGLYEKLIEKEVLTTEEMNRLKVGLYEKLIEKRFLQRRRETD